MLTIGASVLCLINVVTHDSFMVNTQATGIVVKSTITSKMAIVDFSKAAKKEKWQGEYDKKLVEVEKCIEVE